ncbi:MAG: DUF6020 family protein [Lachnospiraceae bacterium]|nr:DUF6020 family protein [Lachnospiraceae bacterium]
MLFAAINLFILFTVAYPGYVTADAIDELDQFLTGAYSNHHPFYHALLLKLFTEAGRGIFGNINAGIALFLVIQILFLAVCFGYAAMTLYETGLPLSVIVTAAALWLLSPYQIAYSVTVWKDIPFGGALLLFTTALFRIMKGIGSRKANECVLIIGAVGFALMRSNGLIALAITFIAVFFVYRKEDRKLLLLLAGVIIGAFLLKHPVLSLLHVTQPDTAETLSIPVQQVAKVITEGGDLNGQEAELQLFFETEKVPSDYREFISDPIKNHMRKKGYINGHMGEFIRLWAKIGVKNPGLYIKAWIDQTRGYYNGGYEYWIYSDYVMENDLGITAGTPVESIRNLLYKWYEKYYGKSIFQPLHSIGFHVWLMALCFFAGAVHKKKEFLLSVPQLAIILTLLISTPVFCEFRYAYSLFTTAPFLFFTTFGRHSSN